MIPSDVDVPYTSKAFVEAHPERLSVLARLWGMTPANAERGRVLEVGCGSGGHLLPIAARYPDALCVGLDLDANEIATARSISERLGLRNVRFEAMDLRSARGVLAGDAPFDFVVAHGMYSWVPADARDSLLALFGDILAEQGVAYLSHNALPGFLLREFLRDMLRVHTGGESSARLRAAAARELAGLLMASPVAGPQAAEMVRREIESLRTASDVRIVYDDLGPNEAFFFGDVVAHAEQNGLSYLCDAVPGADMPDFFRGLAGQALDEIAGDRLRFQQYLDFFIVRHFRRTLLCRKATKLLSRPDPRVIRSLFAAGRSGDASPSIELHSKQGSNTGDRHARVVLSILDARWPGALSYDEIGHAAESAGVAVQTSTADDVLEGILLALYERGLVELFTTPPPAIRRPSERPRAWPPARLSAELGRPVPSLHLASVYLREEQRALLARLDGSQDRSELLASFGNLDHDAAGQLVDRLLAELANSALLVE